MNLRNILLALLVFVAGVSGFLSCYPGGIDSYEDSDIVVTTRNPGALFEGRRTYAITDQVYDLCDLVPDSGDAGVTPPPNEQKPCDSSSDISHRYDSVILDAVRNNLNARGFTEETDPATNAADLVVLVGGANTKMYVYGPYCESWWYFWAGWPGWNPYFPSGGGGSWHVECYPYDVLQEVYDVGTILIHMVDAASGDPGNRNIPSLWLATVNGLAGDTGANTQSRIRRTIDQAFTQSPYINSGSADPSNSN